MKKYEITIVEAITYKQFVCEISAESEQEAKEKAKKRFCFSISRIYVSF